MIRGSIVSPLSRGEGGARLLALALSAILLVTTQPGMAQSPQGGDRPQERRAAEQKGPEGRKLPSDVTTEHSVTLPGGRILRFTATAGSLPLVDEGGKLQAEIAFIAYRLADRSEAARPVTFAINGGPGAASAYLNIGAIGPWRLPLDGTSISPSTPVCSIICSMPRWAGNR